MYIATPWLSHQILWNGQGQAPRAHFYIQTCKYDEDKEKKNRRAGYLLSSLPPPHPPNKKKNKQTNAEFS